MRPYSAEIVNYHRLKTFFPRRVPILFFDGLDGVLKFFQNLMRIITWKIFFFKISEQMGIRLFKTGGLQQAQLPDQNFLFGF